MRSPAVSSVLLDLDAKTERIHQILHAEQPHRSAAVESSADAAIVTGQVAIPQTPDTQIAELGRRRPTIWAGTPTLRSTPANPGLASS